MDVIKQDALNHCMDRIINNMAVMPVVDKLSIILTNEEVSLIKVSLSSVESFDSLHIAS